MLKISPCRFAVFGLFVLITVLCALVMAARGVPLPVISLVRWCSFGLLGLLAALFAKGPTAERVAVAVVSLGFGGFGAFRALRQVLNLL